MFVVTVTFVAQADQSQALYEALIEQARNSLTLEPGCHTFDVCVSTDDEATVFLYEQYADAAAFDDHLASRHFKSFDSRVTPWGRSKSVQTWTISERGQ